MEKINVAELLKDCPTGMELDCTMFDGVKFDGIEAGIYPIRITIPYVGVINLNKFGEHFMYTKNTKCVIFPKGKTTWEGFQRPFKDGEILATDLGSVFILKSCLEDEIHYHSYVGVTCCNEIREQQIPFAYKHVCHLASEKEKTKLFQVIKDNGYKWNPETKTLEKLPKFKVGDKVRYKNDKTVITITGIKDNYYFIQFYNVGKCDYQNEKVLFKDQDKYELVPNKFDINTLVPFESRVLVRNDEGQYWIPAFWGCKRADGYTTTFGWCKYCIPYDGNEHLLETNKDCDEYFKTWK